MSPFPTLNAGEGTRSLGKTWVNESWEASIRAKVSCVLPRVDLNSWVSPAIIRASALTIYLPDTRARDKTRFSVWAS